MRAALAMALLMTLCAVLAGCNGGGAGKKDDPLVDDDEFKDLDATKDTGVIRGVVVDEAIRPIPGATIAITSGGDAKNTTSADSGAFGFDGLAAGTYFLEVSKTGFKGTQVSVDVVAGVAEPEIKKVLLAADPTARPYFVPYQFEGFIGCSVRVLIRGTSCDVAPDSNEEIAFDIDDLAGVPTFAQGELVWDSTQSLGDELSLNWRRDDTNADYADIEGGSPLILTANQTTFAEEEVGAGQPLRTIIFTAHNPTTEPPCLPNVGCAWGAGVQVNQQFNLYVHVFYNMLPPEGWSFGADGDPPQPA